MEQLHGLTVDTRSTGIFDARCHAVGHSKALLDLAQQQNTAVKRQQAAVKSDVQTLATNR